MTTTPERTTELDEIGRYKFGWSDSDVAGSLAKRGLSEEVVRNISALKNEPEWMLKRRLRGLDLFGKKPMPSWGSDLSGIDFENIKYFVRSTEKQADSWDDLPADIKATYDKLGIPEAEKQRLISGVAAQYECLAGDTSVWTANRGQIPIKEVEAGDRVFAFDEDAGRFVVAPVKSAAQTGEKLTYTITAGARIIRATENHPFLVLSDDRKPGRQRARFTRRWKTVAELSAGDLVAVPRDMPTFGEVRQLPILAGRDNVAFGPVNTTPDLMWLIGYFIGDGSLQSSGRTHQVRFAAHTGAPDVRAEIVRIVEAEFGLRGIEADGDRIVVNSKALVEWFVELGLSGGAFSKHVPDWVFGLPEAQRLAFLGGWIDADGDADGYVRPGKSGSVTLTSVSHELLSQAAELAELAGLRAAGPWTWTQPTSHDPAREQSAHRLEISGDFERLDCRNAKRTERSGRRASAHSSVSARGATFRKHTTEHLGFARITGIEEYLVEPVFDIEVDGPHNFLAEGMIVHNSEVVYHQINEELEKQGVLFLDTDTALREHEDIFKEYFGSVIPVGDNKFAALNTAVWSGGSFIYVPKGVHVEIPLQAYFRINTENMGQFERTLIIADEDSFVHYVEGCTAPVYSSDSLHSAVVEIVVKKNARVRYTTIQNWSNNVYNLVTKRTSVAAGGRMEWIDGNLGCLVEGSTVTTPSGVKPIELVMPGDQVLSFDEGAGELCFRTVLGKKYSGEQQVREVSVGERRLTVTDNHPFFSWSYDGDVPKKPGRYALGYIRADELSEAIVPATSIDYGVAHKLARPEPATAFATANQSADGLTAERTRETRLALPDETTEDISWLLGAFTGDGSIDSKPAENGGLRWAKVTFSIPTSDRVRARLERIMADLAPGMAPTLRADGIAVCWNSVELAEFFTLNGFVTGASHKRLPEWVLNLPEAQRVAFVAGYLDSDGCAPAGKRGLSIKSINRSLLEDVATIVTSLGLTSRLYTEGVEDREVTIVGNVCNAKPAHRLEFAADPRLLDAVSPRLRDAALAQISATQRHFRTVGRSSIVLPESVEVRKVIVGEHLGLRRTWDIEVEGTGNFVSQGFIVHNSKVTMKYPACYLLGERASGETLSVAFAGEGQHQDAGAKMVHAAPHTSSQIISKSVARGGGRTSYRGLVNVEEGAYGSKATVKCDALLVDAISRSDTYPYVDVREDDASIGHEASVSKVGADQLFYLMSRGLKEDEAMAMIVRGFVEPIARELPMEYALELNRLIELQMEGSVG